MPAEASRDSFGDAGSEPRWAPPLDRPVTAHSTDVTLRDALDRVAAKAKLHLSYSTELLPLDRVVCLSADAAPVGRVLSDLLQGLNVGAVPVGADQVVLAPRVNSTPRIADSTPAMARSLGVLDRVVVTGNAIGTPERELTVGLNVIDGHELARENNGTLSAALDSYVPGVWSWAQSPANMLTSYGSIRGASSFGLSYPKMYIDGIEVANPLLVGRFNPGSIDHIEVIRGPQGSALYGADAISGVINIVTRHDGVDADGSRASLRTTAGLTQSDFSHSVLSQDHAISLAAGSSTQSADLSVSGGSVGDFIPNGYSKNLMATGSARVVGEHSMLSGTARFFAEEAGPGLSPLLSASPVRPQPTETANTTALESSVPSATGSTPQSVREYTLGTNATFTPNDRWTHSLVAGIDGYRLTNVETNQTPIRSVEDSALRAAQGGADRVTIRGSSVVHFAQSDPTHASLTFSAEQTSLYPTSVLTPSASSLVEPYERTSAAFTGGGPRELVNWQNSTGFTTQGNAVLNNLLFATGGVRVERDSRLVGSDQVVVLPMVGLAAANDYGPLTVKLRAAYGKGVRPPSALEHGGLWQTQTGAVTQPSLGPEVQSGTEMGLDVYLKRAFSLQVTRFDQRASGLIQQVAVAVDTSLFSRRMTYALQNVGEISNRGWELGATGTVSRLTAAGTFSMVDSRVSRLAPGYTGDLLTGDRMLLVPARTGSFNFTWTERNWYASLGGSRALDWINYDELALSQAFASGTRPARDLLGTQLRQYWRQYDGGLRLRATMSRDIRDRFALELTADNLLNYQRDEPDNITVLPGRTLMTGLRVKF